MNRLKHLRVPTKGRPFKAIVVMFFAGVASSLVIVSQAITMVVNIEPETGVPSHGIQIVNDGQASAAKAIRFDSKLPTKIVGGYHRNDSTFRMTRSEMSRYNLLYFAFATSAQSDTGKLTFTPGSYPGGAAQLKADIATLKSQGDKVLISVGGALGGGITVKTDAQIAEFVADVKSISLQYGFSGMDWDLENGGSGTSVYGLSRASAILKRDLGNNYIIGTAPGPEVTVYEDFCRLSSVPGIYNGRPCDLFGPQFYDSTISDTERINYIVWYAKHMINSGMPASVIVVGTTYQNGSAFGAAGGMAPSEYLKAYNQLKNEGYEIRGAYIWSTSNPENYHGWQFVNTFAPALGL